MQSDRGGEFGCCKRWAENRHDDARSQVHAARFLYRETSTPTPLPHFHISLTSAG
jgi:hypothetical protein